MYEMSEVRDAIDHSDFRQNEFASLGRVLREERERQGMTCQAFADSLHMGYPPHRLDRRLVLTVTQLLGFHRPDPVLGPSSPSSIPGPL